jgi:hypothetical protein
MEIFHESGRNRNCCDQRADPLIPTTRLQIRHSTRRRLVILSPLYPRGAKNQRESFTVERSVAGRTRNVVARHHSNFLDLDAPIIFAPPTRSRSTEALYCSMEGYRDDKRRCAPTCGRTAEAGTYGGRPRRKRQRRR